MPVRATLDQTPFAVVDVETTGVFPGGHDRVIEIAILRVLPGGQVEDEYATLINPKRDIGRADIHGITSGELQHAPEFADVAGDIGKRLQGAIVAGHNVRFDLDFIRAEFRRLGTEPPPFPTLCTLRLAHLLETAPSRTLSACCAAAGVVHEGKHTAIGDVRATAKLLARYLERAKEAGVSGLHGLGCTTDEIPDSGWFPFQPLGRAVSRSTAAAEQGARRNYLAQLIARLPGAPGSSVREAEYLSLLDRVLEDRTLTPGEAESLCSAAEAWGMAQNDIAGAHQAFVWALARQARSDGVVTVLERRDLTAVCELLAVPSAMLARILDVPGPTASPRAEEDGTGLLGGLSVCFTGELLGTIGGERVSREQAEDRARSAGMLVQNSVTKSLDVLVVADPETQSGKAKKARGYGTRIMAEATFWAAIGEAVE